ncbi:unnamed protein product, partial [Symbiodinium necroappetens]
MVRRVCSTQSSTCSVERGFADFAGMSSRHTSTKVCANTFPSFSKVATSQMRPRRTPATHQRKKHQRQHPSPAD